MALLSQSVLRLQSRLCYALRSRSFGSTSTTSTAAGQRPKREYYYTIDHLGLVYLDETKIRNFTSAVKDAAFLDLFYRRMKYNRDGYPDHRAQGWTFYSLCMGEVNFVKPDDSVLVFQKLIDGRLTYAGTMSMRFEPESLRVDPETGYLYHPSPIIPRSTRRARRRAQSAQQGQQHDRDHEQDEDGTGNEGAKELGQYSLLRSSLVLEHFASTLEMDEQGATFEYQDRQYSISTLAKDQVLR